VRLFFEYPQREKNFNTVTGNFKIKKAVKILGVHFTYDLGAKQKLNVDKLISSIQQIMEVEGSEVEGSEHYRKNSNGQNLYHSYFPVSCQFDISK